MSKLVCVILGEDAEVSPGDQLLWVNIHHEDFHVMPTDKTPPWEPPESPKVRKRGKDGPGTYESKIRSDAAPSSGYAYTLHPPLPAHVGNPRIRVKV